MFVLDAKSRKVFVLDTKSGKEVGKDKVKYGHLHEDMNREGGQRLHCQEQGKHKAMVSTNFLATCVSCYRLTPRI